MKRNLNNLRKAFSSINKEKEVYEYITLPKKNESERISWIYQKVFNLSLSSIMSLLIVYYRDTRVVLTYILDLGKWNKNWTKTMLDKKSFICVNYLEHCLVFLQTIPNQAMNHLFTRLLLILHSLIDIDTMKAESKAKVNHTMSKLGNNRLLFNKMKIWLEILTLVTLQCNNFEISLHPIFSWNFFSSNPVKSTLGKAFVKASYRNY